MCTYISFNDKPGNVLYCLWYALRLFQGGYGATLEITALNIPLTYNLSHYVVRTNLTKTIGTVLSYGIIPWGLLFVA